MKKAVLFLTKLVILGVYFNFSADGFKSAHAARPKAHLSAQSASSEEGTDDLANDLGQISLSDGTSTETSTQEDKSDETPAQAEKQSSAHAEERDPTNPNGFSLALIPYRSEKGGKGAFYDHYTFQTLTGHGSLTDANSDQLNEFKAFLSDIQVGLPFGETDSNQIIPFPVSRFQEKAGLLLIPGRSRANQSDTERTQRENQHIQNALNRGQPILAICAGCVQLFKKQGGHPIDVTDHNYNGGMLRLNNEGRPVYNVQIHNILVQRDSLLANAMELQNIDNAAENFEVLVNSVHWECPDETSLPANWTISARAQKNSEISVKTRQSTTMSPQEGTVEAFESQFGAPVIGVQWHPEGYTPNDLTHHKSKNLRNFSPMAHVKLIRFMALAGDAYSAKRKMLREFLLLYPTPLYSFGSSDSE